MFFACPIQMHKNLSFNRYMVECEFDKSNRLLLNVMVLIDTWWNVNRPQILLNLLPRHFNRYMVECE